MSLLIAFLRELMAASRYRLSVFGFEYLRRLAFCSHRLMSFIACRMMESWLDRRDSAQFLFGPVYGNVVINRLLNSVSVQRAIKRCLQEIGRGKCRGYTAQALRVGAAQELLRMGRYTADIMRAGGWKSVSTLAR